MSTSAGQTSRGFIIFLYLSAYPKVPYAFPAPASGSAAAAARLLIAGGSFRRQTVGRKKLVHRELHLTEDLTGVLLAALTAAAGTLLIRQAVIIGGDEQLGIPLHADDGELSQGDVQAVDVAPQHQLLREAGADGGGDLTAAVSRAALAHIHQLHTQNDGVHRLHHCGGVAPAGQSLEVQRPAGRLGGEYLRAPLTAEQNDTLVKHRQARDLHRPRRPHKGIRGDAVEIPNIHRIEAPVEADRLHIDVGIQQLRAPRLHRDRPVDHLLTAPGGVDPQVLDTVFILAGIKNLFRVYTHGFPDAALLAHGAGYDLFRHYGIPPITCWPGVGASGPLNWVHTIL